MARPNVRTERRVRSSPPVLCKRLTSAICDGVKQKEASGRRTEPAGAGRHETLTWVLTDLKPEVHPKRAGAAQIERPSLPPRRDLQSPCRLLP